MSFKYEDDERTHEPARSTDLLSEARLKIRALYQLVHHFLWDRYRPALLRTYGLDVNSVCQFGAAPPYDDGAGWSCKPSPLPVTSQNRTTYLYDPLGNVKQTTFSPISGASNTRLADYNGLTTTLTNERGIMRCPPNPFHSL